MQWTDQQIQNAVADVLQETEGTLVVGWQNICINGHQWAYNQILLMLARKGYLASQLALSDQLPGWEMSLSIYKSLASGAALQAVDDKLLQSFDIRKDLEECPGLTIAGAWADPQGTAGQCMVGLEDTSQDTFTYPGPDGTNSFGGSLGETTRW